MKVAFVRARYSPFGGAERFAARALSALAADPGGIEVAVLARRWSDIEADGAGRPIRFVRCDPFYLGSVWRDASFAAAVHRRLAVERFDLVQSHERIVGLPIYRAGDGVHAAWLERRSRWATSATRIGIAMSPHHRYLVATERKMFEHPALRIVICNSEMVRREIAARFAIDASKLVLIRNGVDLARFHPSAADAARDVVRRRLAIAHAATAFVMVGSGFERKGVGPALVALAACAEAALVVVGGDKHQARYIGDASRLGVIDRVRFVGPVDDPLPYYAAADVLLAPALYDPFPNAALEALACGLPVIASDACGVAELLDAGVNGWVFPTGDLDALVAAMRSAINRDAAGRTAMRSAARRTAEPYSPAALSGALLGLYRSLLGPR